MYAPIADVRRFTKRYRFAAMCRALQEAGVPFRLAVDGEPLVRQDDLDGRPADAKEPGRLETLESIAAHRAPYRGTGDGPAFSGIYFLFSGDDLVYVGKAKSIANRMTWHRNAKRFEFDSYACLAVPLKNLDEYEPHYIHALKPRHNVAYNWRQ